jgi:uncharacterized protein YndB with AHSA1/START domain
VAASNANSAPAPIMLVVSRQFDAARETVFDAWLDAESIAQWLFATPGGVMERVEINPRVGGGFEVFERRGAILAEHYGTFVALDRPRLLAFDVRSGADTPATRVSVQFEARDGGCLVTLTHALDPQWAEYSERVKAGWSGILEGLERALQGEIVADREIAQIREYHAPRDLVWEMWTKPEHVDQWWGPDGFVTHTENMDVRPDGLWRYTMTAPDGTVFPNHQLYMDVAPPERLIYAHGGGDPAAPPDFYVTVLFEALGPKRTRVSMTSRFSSKAARDFVVEKFGAIEGGRQTMARLAEYLRTRGR